MIWKQNSGIDMQNFNVPPVEGVAGGGTSYGWVHQDREGPSQLTSGEIDPTKVQSTELLHVWCMPSTANVGQQEVPRPLEPVSLFFLLAVILFIQQLIIALEM